MKSFVYGLVMGAACAYVYVSHGSSLGATLDTVLAWRNSAQTSVSGFGGTSKRLH